MYCSFDCMSWIVVMLLDTFHSCNFRICVRVDVETQVQVEKKLRGTP